jgi:nitrite reductase (NADH) small subunit
VRNSYFTQESHRKVGKIQPKYAAFCVEGSAVTSTVANQKFPLFPGYTFSMPWHRIVAVDDCPPGKGLESVVGEQIVALFNVEGEYFAIDGVCPHQGGPLGQGPLTGCIVTCPWHGWQFDVKTGQHQLSRTLRQPCFPVKIDDGGVWVLIEEPSVT